MGRDEEISNQQPVEVTMKLITKEVLKKLKPFGTYSEASPENIPIAVKFFTPDSNWTWWIVEGEVQEDADIRMYGLVEGFEREWGYVMLSELQSARGSLGLPVERDLWFDKKTIADVQ